MFRHPLPLFFGTTCNKLISGFVRQGHTAFAHVNHEIYTNIIQKYYSMRKDSFEMKPTDKIYIINHYQTVYVSSDPKRLLSVKYL